MITKIKTTRKTTESAISVGVDFEKTAPDYRKKIKTPYPFLSHMIEHIAYRGGITIETDINLDEFALAHLVCEDLGQTFGKVLSDYLASNSSEGIKGYGSAVGIIDEAYAEAAISFENRAYFSFTTEGVSVPTVVENINSEDLITFLDGVCQGAMCTIHLNLKRGVNGHHIWESAFRAIGSCLFDALSACEERKNKTSGVAGKITYETERQ